MKKLFLLIFLGPCLLSLAQLRISPDQLGLNDINQLNKDIIELKINNTTNQDLFVLRLQGNRNISYKYQSMSIPAQGSTRFRFKLNPGSKGKLKETIQFYFAESRKPLEIQLTADVKDIPKNDLQACPDFGKRNSRRRTSPKQMGSMQYFEVNITDENSEFLVAAEQKDDNHTEEEKYASEDERPLLEKLFGNEEEKAIEETEESVVIETKEEINTKAQDDRPLLEKLFGEEETETIEKERLFPAPETKLLSDAHKPNHIVFLLDISNSMADEQKIDLLKQAMIALLNPLREIDYLSIASYAGEAKVLLSPTVGSDKQNISRLIQNLKADGSTNAVKGIDLAINLAESKFLPQGNNEIYLITDGAFDIGGGNETTRNQISDAAGQGIRLNVVGIKNQKWVNKSLKELSELGEGSFLKISSERQADKIVEQVKENSLS
jgi:Mg-chelatase subunit ChlD